MCLSRSPWFNQNELTRRNIVTGVDLATYTPSLSVASNNGPDRATYSIRGFTQEANTAPSVGVYFADVVIPRGTQDSISSGGGVGPGRFFDLQNVQVLKGPQGTLFGRNTTGGSVLLVPKKPTNRFEGYVEGSVGNYDLRRIEAVVNVPVSDTIRLRVGVDRQKRDGYIVNKSGVSADRFADLNYTSVRGSLVIDLTPNLENYTIASYIRSNTTGYITKLNACAPSVGFGGFACGQLQQVAASGEGFFTTRADVPSPFSLNKEFQVINTTTWQASDVLRVKNIFSYGTLTVDAQLELTGTNFRTPAVPPIPGLLPTGFGSYPFPFVHVLSIPGSKTVNMRTFVEEFQLQGNSLGGKLEWQTGVYYERSTPNGSNGQAGNVFNSCVDAVALQCTDALGVLTGLGFGLPPGAVNVGTVAVTTDAYRFRDVGIYGQATYSLTDNLKVTLGARYTWDRETLQISPFSYQFAVSTPLPPTCAQPDAVLPTCRVDFLQKSDAPTWVGYLEYHPTDRALLYAKYSRGYRAGGISGVLAKSIANFEPEKVDAYEIGSKLSAIGALPVTFNIAGFYNDFSNQQVSVNFMDNPAIPGILPPQVGILNVGKSRIYGVELETSVRPFSRLTLSGNYTYLRTNVRSVVVPDTAGQPYLVSTSIRKGDDLTFSPRNKFTLTANYELPVEQKIGFISVGGTFSYSGRQRTDYTSRTLLATGVVVLDGNLRPLTNDPGVVSSTKLVNLNLEWRSVASSRVDLRLFVTNLFNNKYYTFNSGFLVSTGIGAGAVNEPRIVGGRVRVSF